MSPFKNHALFLAAAAFAAAPPRALAQAADTFVQTYEAPTLLSTTSSIAGGTENFDAIALGSTGFVTTFGGSAFTGTYSAGAQISNPDQYGAAAGIGHYVVTFASPGGYSIALNQQANYFVGYWLSALDSGNGVVEFYNGICWSRPARLGRGARLDRQQPTAYFGNLERSVRRPGRSPALRLRELLRHDPAASGRIVFREDPAVGGYESDNHTVGIVPRHHGHAGNPGQRRMR